MEGDYLTTGPGSQAEVQLDYSNLLRLDQHSSVRLASLGNRSFLIQIERGTVTYSELRGGDADVDIETPLVAIRPQKHGRYRIEVASVDEVIVTARQGSAEVTSADGGETLKEGQRMIVRGGGPGVEFQVARAIPKDAWDRWNERRDRQLTKSNVYANVNRSIYGAEDLDPYGRWVHVPRYGRCWFPSVTVGWAPYRHGRWVWLDYYGWSWVSHDPWGWAPYHYGRWFRHARHGWGWHPGSYASHHRWRPALVAFFGYNGPQVGLGVRFGHYGWIPLAPGEPYYPWFGRRYRGSSYGSGRVGAATPSWWTTVSTSTLTIATLAIAMESRWSMPDFSRGQMLNARSLQASELRQAKVMRGRIPVVPGRSSQGKLIRGTGRSVRGASNPIRFYSTGRARRSVTRNSFRRQRQEMADLVRSAGRTDSRAGRGANVRSSSKENVRRPAATSRGQKRPNTRPGLKASSRRSSRSPSGSAARPGRKPAGRSAAGRTKIRSSGKGAGRPGQRGSRVDRRQSTERTLTNRTPPECLLPPQHGRAPVLPDRWVGLRRLRPTTTLESTPGATGVRRHVPLFSVPRSSSSRRNAPSARSSSSRVSAGSSGRSSSRKDSTRSRQSSESDDQSAKDRKSAKGKVRSRAGRR